MRLVVAGSRTFDNMALLRNTLDGFIPDGIEVTILSGGAVGADRIGEQYAKERGLTVERYLPDWTRFGRSAGLRRNKEMLLNADHAVFFWDGTSRGTKHAIGCAKTFGVLYLVVLFGEKYERLMNSYGSQLQQTGS